MRNNKASKRNGTRFYVVGGIVFLIAVIICSAIAWFLERFGISFSEILYTAISPLKGAGIGFLSEAVIFTVKRVIVFAIAWTGYCFLDKRFREKLHAEITIGNTEKHVTWNLYTVVRTTFCILAAVILCRYSYRLMKTLNISGYISSRANPTTIYEDYYISPDSTEISAPEKRKNLIYIYLESMETTYASRSVGGSQPTENYIPNLTNLAVENISFSNTDKLGGFLAVKGTSWTIASLFAQTSGLNFAFPVSNNNMNLRSNFASGVTALGDILAENGYRQEFLCGSDGDFAGRDTYFQQHGNYKIFDLYSAREEGYIPEDYYVWWGYEDAYLYEIAKDELQDLASDTEHPFNLTMLTVDTHHVDGYVCNLCPTVYSEQLGNVLLCADSQVYNFIQWCKEQPFYEDTVIIIAGDHPRMDKTFVENAEVRPVYNCYLNTGKDESVLNTTNRTFTAMDMFPTTLSALGFQIEGDRLGLGTDMFSQRETLAEELGFSYFYEELGKYSQFYVESFS